MTRSPIRLNPAFPLGLGPIRKYPQDDQPIRFLHQHDCLEIGYWHDGSGIFAAEGKVFRFRGGDVAVTPPGVFHFAQSSKGTVSRGTWIFLDSSRLLAASFGEAQSLVAFLGHPELKNIISGKKHPEVVELVRAIIRELDDAKPGYRTAAKGLVLALLVRLERLLPAGGNRTAVAGRRRTTALARLAPALDILSREYSSEIDFSRLSKACHTSPASLRRLFKTVLSKSPQDYLPHLRIQAAAVMLENTDKRVLDVALDCGFNTLSNFTRMFHRTLGVSPREWRDKHNLIPTTG